MARVVLIASAILRWLPMVLELVGLFGWAAFFGLRKAVRHSLCLFGKQTFKSDQYITYRFAIQNNEDVALRGNWQLSVRVLNEDGAFIDSPASGGGPSFAVYAGCNSYETPRWDHPNTRERSITFFELPAYDTWTIDCTMNAQSRDVRLEIEAKSEVGDSEKRATAKSRLSHSKLTLAADRPSALIGRGITPERSWAAAITGLAVVTYVIFVLNFIPEMSLYWTGAIALSITACGVLTFICIKRKAPPVVQGYWTDSREFQ